MTAEEYQQFADYYNARWARCMAGREKAVRRLAAGTTDPILNKAAEVAYQIMLDERFADYEFIQSLQALIQSK
jgi:hypothetical protein